MPEKVLVTGATGYIAGWLIRYLIEEGHEVHATVRDKSNQAKIQHLLDAAAESSGTLFLHEADLLTEKAFDVPMKDCSVVFHTASPFTVGKIKDPENMLIKPALRGTENVLGAVNRTDSVRRVVLTSSIVAVYGDSVDIRNTPNGVFDETLWNKTSSQDHQPYPYSKTLAEKRAWELQKQQNRWDMVTINPGFVLGPSLTRFSRSASIDMMRDIGSGRAKSGLPEIYFGIADVREVARAHITAAFNIKTEGRYIISGEVLSLFDLADRIRDDFPLLKLPAKPLPNWLAKLVGPLVGFSRKFLKKNLGIKIRIDNAKSIRDLGVSYRPVKETLREQMSQLIADGIV